MSQNQNQNNAGARPGSAGGFPSPLAVCDGAASPRPQAQGRQASPRTCRPSFESGIGAVGGVQPQDPTAGAGAGSRCGVSNPRTLMIAAIQALRAGDTAAAIDALDVISEGNTYAASVARWARRAVWRGLTDTETAQVIGALQDVAA